MPLSDAIAPVKLTFAPAQFPSEAAVKAWLGDNGYTDVKVAKTDTGWDAVDVDTDLSGYGADRIVHVSTNNGVSAYVLTPEPATTGARKTDSSGVHKVALASAPAIVPDPTAPRVTHNSFGTSFIPSVPVAKVDPVTDLPNFIHDLSAQTGLSPQEAASLHTVLTTFDQERSPVPSGCITTAHREVLAAKSLIHVHRDSLGRCTITPDLSVVTKAEKASAARKAETPARDITTATGRFEAGVGLKKHH